MKLPLSFINDFVDIKDITPKEYMHALTMSGSKVETIEYLGKEIENVYTGKILSISAHPDAQKLCICMLDVKKHAPVQIVTGANNMKIGDIVPVALSPAKLPGGITIKTEKLRGIESSGMMCSHNELGLTLSEVPYANDDGLLIMPENTTVGEDIRKVLGLDEYVVEFEITSNRPDCLSVLGIARESAATFRKGLNYTAPETDNIINKGPITNYLDVDINTPHLCLRYSTKIVKDVKIAPSPDWLRQRLYACGIRSINNIVDITNYIMLLYGQPMHAFDYDCIENRKINVRAASDNETIKTLDGFERKLDASMLVISDEKKPIAIAGVIGGANSEIKLTTHTVVFESATFSGPSVRLTSKALGIRTESSSRYEKGLDAQNTVPALMHACKLIEELNAGTVVQGMIDIVGNRQELNTIPLEVDKINAILGTNIKKQQMSDILTSLGFGVQNDLISVPSFRSDVETTADVSEEIARIYGYDKIPTTLFAGHTVQGALSDIQKFENHTHELLRAYGFDEIVTHSFISPKAYEKILLPQEKRISTAITNPLGEDFSIMRTTTLYSMLSTLSLNHSFRNKDIKLYELGKIYLPKIKDNLADKNRLPDERKILTLGALDLHFFDLKGYIESLLERSDISDIRFEAVTDNPSYHPGQCAKITSGSTIIGIFGTIHPLVSKNFELPVNVLCAEIDITSMFKKSNSGKTYAPLPKFPAMTRDIAVICDTDIPVLNLKDCIKASTKNILEDIKLFDVYQGAQVKDGKKSVAFSIIFRANDRTLTVEECDNAVSKVLSCLKKDFNAVLRS